LALSQQDKKDLSADALFKEANQRVRTQIGAIASLGGLICGTAIIPKTRSGKTIRRTLRELVENGAKGVFEDVAVSINTSSSNCFFISKLHNAFEGFNNEKLFFFFCFPLPS